MFWLGNKKNNFEYALLTKGMDKVQIYIKIMYDYLIIPKMHGVYSDTGHYIESLSKTHLP